MNILNPTNPKIGNELVQLTWMKMSIWLKWVNDILNKALNIPCSHGTYISLYFLSDKVDNTFSKVHNTSTKDNYTSTKVILR